MKFKECPWCRYRMTLEQWEWINYDVKCPWCYSSFYKFKLIGINEPDLDIEALELEYIKDKA